MHSKYHTLYVIMIKTLLNRFNETTKNNIALTQPQYTVFGLFQLLYIPLTSYLNNGLTQVSSIDIIVRSIVLCFCALLSAHSLWPHKLKSSLPYFWYITVILSLPFLNTYLMLRNYASLEYIISLMLASLLMALIIDWFRVIIFTFTGILLGFLLFWLVTPHNLLVYDYYQGGISFMLRYPNLFILFFMTIVVAMIFSRSIAKNRENLRLNSQFLAMQTVAASIAHELRTPLTTIQAGIKTANDYLPKLLEKHAKNAINCKALSSQTNLYDIELLSKTLRITSQEIINTHKIINMLLVKLGNINLQKEAFEVCDLHECIKTAIERYPFITKEDKNLIFIDIRNNFKFLGDPILFIHVIFNLIKNALYFIRSSKKGNITIFTDTSKQVNKLYFNDSSQGIENHILPKIFDQFFTQSNGGAGIGLAFCKKVMVQMNGDITCKSVFGEYTQFVLSFPKIPHVLIDEK